MPNAFLSSASSSSSSSTSNTHHQTSHASPRSPSFHYSHHQQHHNNNNAPKTPTDSLINSLISHIESFGHIITSLKEISSSTTLSPAEIRDERRSALQQRDEIKRLFLEARSQLRKRGSSISSAHSSAGATRGHRAATTTSPIMDNSRDSSLGASVVSPMSPSNRRYVTSQLRVLDRLESQFQELKDKLTLVLKIVGKRERELSRKMREEMYSTAYGMGTGQQQMAQSRSAGSDSAQNASQQQQQQQQQLTPVVLSDADASTIEVEKMLARETRDHLLNLESDMGELQSCLKDLNLLVKDQQADLDAIEDNVVQANRYIEVGISDVKASKGMTFTEQLKSGVSKPMRMMRFFSG